MITSTLVDDLNYNLMMSKLDVDRNVFVDSLYTNIRYMTKSEEMFERLTGPKVSDIFTYDEIEGLYQDVRKYSRIKEKTAILDSVLVPKGFIRASMGTNRAVYTTDKDKSFVIKIALDSAAMTNNPDEMVNQKYLAPYVTKCFDISHNGMIGTFERVIPIENSIQFWNVRDDIYNIIQKIIRRFVIDDFGTNVFKNWGIREGFGPVLLDYADLYILDEDELYCRNIIHEPDGSKHMCKGRIKYNPGYNRLQCIRCGHIEPAKTFAGRPKISCYVPKRRDRFMKFKMYDEDGKLCYDSNEKIYNNVGTSEETVKPDEAVKELNQDLKQMTDQVNELDPTANQEPIIIHKGIHNINPLERARGTVTDINQMTDYINKKKETRVIIEEKKEEPKKELKPIRKIKVAKFEFRPVSVKQEVKKLTIKELDELKNLISDNIKIFKETMDSDDKFSEDEIKGFISTMDKFDSDVVSVNLRDFIPECLLIDSEDKYGFNDNKDLIVYKNDYESTLDQTINDFYKYLNEVL